MFFELENYIQINTFRYKNIRVGVILTGSQCPNKGIWKQLDPLNVSESLNVAHYKRNYVFAL